MIDPSPRHPMRCGMAVRAPPPGRRIRTYPRPLRPGRRVLIVRAPRRASRSPTGRARCKWRRVMTDPAPRHSMRDVAWPSARHPSGRRMQDVPQASAGPGAGFCIVRAPRTVPAGPRPVVRGANGAGSWQTPRRVIRRDGAWPSARHPQGTGCRRTPGHAGRGAGSAPSACRATGTRSLPIAPRANGAGSWQTPRRVIRCGGAWPSARHPLGAGSERTPGTCGPGAGF